MTKFIGKFMKNYGTSVLKISYLEYSQTKNLPIVPLDECRRFVTDCMKAVGAPEAHAKAVADVLAEADYRGIYSHGMNRLEMYLKEIQHGVCNPKAVPKILKETPATAWVDGDNGLGVIVATFSMDLAIQKAKNVGIGMVVCKGSNHYGIAAMYTMQAMKKNLIGVTCTNTSPVVAPTRTKLPAIGTNPISVAASALNEDSFVLDISTSAVALGKIQLKTKTKSEVPSQWLEAGTHALQPMGAGATSDSSHKGFGLGVLVELLCGILGGGAYGPNIRVSGVHIRRADIGHNFVAIDPTFFAPGFQNRLEDFLTTLRKLKPTDPEKPVLIAGDIERLHMKTVDEVGGVRYAQEQLNSCNDIAASLKVKTLQPKGT